MINLLRKVRSKKWQSLLRWKFRDRRLDSLKIGNKIILDFILNRFYNCVCAVYDVIDHAQCTCCPVAMCWFCLERKRNSTLTQHSVPNKNQVTVPINISVKEINLGKEKRILRIGEILIIIITVLLDASVR